MWEAITTSSPWLGLVQTDSLRGETLLPYTAIALTALAGTPATVTKSLCLYGEQRKGFSLATVKVYGTGLGIFLGILCLVPLIGLIVLLAVNGKETRVLKQNGIKVGLLGATPLSI